MHDPQNSSTAPSLLARPRQQRLLEYKQRCAQAIVFGLPMLGLQWFGHLLGGAPMEQQRWISILQALLSGWVIYVGATGMLIEGIFLWPRVTADFVVAMVATLIYLFSAISTTGIFFIGRPFYGPLLFHWSSILLAGWCGWRWWGMSRE